MCGSLIDHSDGCEDLFLKEDLQGWIGLDVLMEEGLISTSGERGEGER